PWFDDTVKELGTEMSIASLALATGDAQVSTAAARMDAARRARTPDLTVSVGARRFNESGDTAAVLLVSVPFPWFNRGTEELARATAELDRAKADRDAIALEAE